MPPQSLNENLQSFGPAQLGRYIKKLRSDGRKNFVTFLIGAGFSRSAGIPSAGEIVRELRDEQKGHPLLRDAGTPPGGVSEYAFLMKKLGSPKERATWVKKFIDQARNKKTGQLNINWAHLLLATMVEHEYVHRILTTNFDPLIVEALALTAQPIRTFDLNSTGHFYPGTLDSGAVIYLHGQMHSLFLANAPDEMERIKPLYSPVLQEAIQDSILIVVGYSGECDPVLAALKTLPSFPWGLWWAHYHPTGTIPCPEVQSLLSDNCDSSHLSCEDDADTFMRKLALEGLNLNLPRVVMQPFATAETVLKRITEYPCKGLEGGNIDPLPTARALVQKAQDLVNEDAKLKKNPETSESLARLSEALVAEMAALVSDEKTLEKLQSSIAPNPGSLLSQRIGTGYCQFAQKANLEKRHEDALKYLAIASKFGVTDDWREWLPLIWGNTFLELAKLSSNSLAVDLLKQAIEKYAQALKIKPDRHEALNNWGVALSSLSKLTKDRSEADRFLALATEKYAQVLKINSKKHEALNNWGNALCDQAKLTDNPNKADRLFTLATEKYAQALKIKPDKHEALTNWSIMLGEQAKLQSDSSETDRLLTLAGEKCVQALKIKPDKHDALNNWGLVLGEQAKLQSNLSEADRLLTLAGEKYAQALKIKADNDEVLNNWGVALGDQAKLKQDPSEADRLFTLAGEKYTQALIIKPHNYQSHYNLGCLSAQRKNIPDCLGHLAKWKQYDPTAWQKTLDKDSDFDLVRENPEFKAFRDSLPTG